jgi:hypothetical protein
MSLLEARMVVTMHIEFHLRALQEIRPWHDADGSHPHLSWFGLTDGWYWIQVGETELFRYTQAALTRWAQHYPGAPSEHYPKGLPYVDYQVARLWMDLLDLLPDVLAPLPPHLARILSAEGIWSTWQEQAEKTAREALPAEGVSDLLYEATRWWYMRMLDSAYLVQGPLIVCWSDGEQAHIQWDNRECLLDGIPVWEASVGHHVLSLDVFRAAIADFDARFMRRMADRVAIAQGEWSRPEIELHPEVAKQQVANAQWGQKALANRQQREPDDWEKVFQSIAALEALPAFGSGQALRLPL